jgi:flagellar biosynthesis protein FliR
MATFNLPIEQIQALLFIFFRMSTILFFLPIFDNRSVPPLFKIGLALVLSLLVAPMIEVKIPADFSNEIYLMLGLISEILLGIAIGLSIRMVFAGIQLAGQFVGYEMGLSIANVLDPTLEEQNSIISEFQYLLAMLVFFAMNAHHWFIIAVFESYVLIPPFGFNLSGSMVEYLMTLGGNMFVIAIKLSAPIIVTLLLTSIAFGLIARTVPQMNVFFVAMPLKVVIGFGFIALILPMMASFLVSIFGDVKNILDILLKIGAT